ncbi:hypothetical protein BSL78_28720, partial [Apostichopus japonicus]
PVIRILIDMTSLRFVALVGGTVYGMSFIILGLFAKNIWHVFVLHTLIGLSSASVNLATYVAIGEQFETSFGVANSASYLIASIIGIIFPLLVLYFNVTYGLRWTLMLYGAISLHLNRRWTLGDVKENCTIQHSVRRCVIHQSQLTTVARRISCEMHFRSAVAWLTTFAGVGATFAGLFAGWIHGINQSYQYVVMSYVGLSIIQCLLALAILVLKQDKECHVSPSATENSCSMNEPSGWHIEKTVNVEINLKMNGISTQVLHGSRGGGGGGDGRGGEGVSHPNHTNVKV